MNPAHKKIYEFVVEYILDHKYPPSIREICRGVGYRSTSTVSRYLHELREEGLIETDSGLDRPRAIRVPELVIVRREDDKRRVDC